MSVSQSGPGLAVLLDWIAEEQGASVSFLDLAAVCGQVPALALRLDQKLHSHAYCLYAKGGGGLGHCIANRQRSVSRGRRSLSPWWGCCPHGLWDFALPVREGGELLGILYLGAFRAGKPLARHGKSAYADTPIPLIDDARRQQLESRGHFLARYILLAYWRWRQAGHRLKKKQSPEAHWRAAERLLKTRYTEPLTLAALARELGLHPVYLGTLIRAQSGKSFKALLLALRLEPARVRLKNGDESVTWIAHECGFRDSNYFSQVFRRAYGVSPRTYRRQGRA